MGKIKRGILGGFSGKVGPIVGSSWKGKAYMKSAPLHVRNPRTLEQQCQRKKFAMVMKFLTAINPYLKFGYKNKATDKTAMNAAMSYMLKNGCVVGEFPNYTIDYASAKVATGDLRRGQNVSFNLIGNIANYHWTDNSDNGNAHATDFAMGLLYNPAKNEAEYDIGNATRADGSLQFSFPPEWMDDRVEVYLSFMSEDGKQVSESEYVGEVLIE